MQQFVTSLYAGAKQNVEILANLYIEKEKEREAQFRPHLFQAKPGELPIPTFEEQYESGKIFPDSQEQCAQYYTCNFN